MKYIKLKNYYGMEYLTVYLKVSQTHPEHGDLVDSSTMRQAEMSVSEELIKRRIPIRGIELRFLRKALGLSLRDLGSLLGLSHAAIDKWEKTKKKRLEPINEAAIRSIFAQLMKVEITGWFDDLKGTKTPEKFEIKTVKVG